MIADSTGTAITTETEIKATTEIAVAIDRLVSRAQR
jgi:hypothetical protein